MTLWQASMTVTLTVDSCILGSMCWSWCLCDGNLIHSFVMPTTATVHNEQHVLCPV